MAIIYIAPSNQRNNKYTGKNTTEAAECIDIANKVKKILEAYDCTCVVGEEKKRIEEKAAEANKLGASVYLSIHSNAGGGRGTEVWFNPNTKGSKEFANAVYAKISSISPGKDRGLKSSTAYLDVKLPKMPCCLCEMEFHDWADGAKWIVENKDKIAEQFVAALVEYLGIKKKKVEKKPTTTTSKPTSVKITKGDTVKLNKGAKYYDGKTPASFVYNRNHKVKEVSGDRVVITFIGITIGAVHAKDLTIISSANKTTTTTKKTNEQIAKEVIAGKWGNGTERKKKLTEAGYDYSAIQKIVNKLLS